jgi:hypothetical protein
LAQTVLSRTRCVFPVTLQLLRSFHNKTDAFSASASAT